MSTSRFARSNGHPPPSHAPLPPGLFDFEQLWHGAPPPCCCTGKLEPARPTLACLIHGSGPRANEPFVQVNCGAVSDP